MSTIQELFQQAQLAEAAYADFAYPDGAEKALTNEGFGETQATELLTHWRVVDQYTAPAGLFGLTDGTGFSATVFESLDHPGQYTFSMRGTQPGYADLAADLGDIASDGLALDQIVDMYNYWQSLHHNLGYTAYKLETQLAETVHLTTLWAQVAIPGASIYAKGN